MKKENFTKAKVIMDQIANAESKLRVLSDSRAFPRAVIIKGVATEISVYWAKPTGDSFPGAPSPETRRDLMEEMRENYEARVAKLTEELEML